MRTYAQRLGPMTVVVGSMLLYVLVAALLLRDAGNVILGTAIVPIIATATLYGRRGGVLGAGAVIVIGTSLAAAYETLDEPRAVFIRYAIALGLGWLVGQSAERADQVREELSRRREAEEELQASTTRLEGLLESQNEFVATVSHELRTPLTGVVGFAETLRDGFGVLTQEEIKELVVLIADQASDVADIVEDLLVVARLESGQLDVHPETLDIDHEVTAVLTSGLRDEDGVDIEVQFTGDSLQAYADPQRVRQILRNLLTNAVRYGEQPISINPVRDGTEVVIRVIDEGDGVPPDHEELIFEPYHRANGENAKTGSVGLGLTVSHQLAVLMDGDLTYGRDGGRTVFSLRLPTTG